MVFNNQTIISNKNRNTNLFNRTIISAITLLLLVSGIYSAVILLNNAAAAGTQVITGNTSSGENVPGWMFNRDPSTVTPFQFKTGNPSVGTGSVYVPPISGAASNKFIAEHFSVMPISDVNSISFDYKLGAGQPVNNGQHFYMNVYANFADSDDLKFYDCRYNVIGNVGSTGSFTTLTFDPATAHNVTTRGGASPSPYTCPAVPNDMNTIGGAGANIRAYSVSVGDTTSSDTGVDGYVDNVVLDRDSDGVTVYDFESTPIVACSSTSTAMSNNFTSWDLSQTRATGHNQITSNGLRAWTEGATSTDKAAGYRTTDFALADVGVPNIEFASYTGGRPSLQLGLDKDANGTRDAYLVYEPWAYGEGNYWSGTAGLGVNPGLGYPSFGTLQDYLDANPTARIVQVGYSLGSGVLGDATISKLTAGCVDYTFGTVPPTITNLKVTNPNWGDGYNILNIPNHQSTVSGRPTVGGNLKVSADFADDVILTNVISYLPGRGFFDQSEYTPTPVNNGTWQPVPQGNYSVAWDTKNGVDWRAVPDGDYTFMFEARDGDEGQNQHQNSTTVPVNLTVDNTAPTVAFTGTTPADGATVSGTINVQGDFNDVNGLMNTDIGIHAIAWYCHTDWPAVGTKSCSIDTTTLPEGPQQITMNGRDKAGNTFQVFRSITVNNDPPVITGTTFNEEPSGQSVLTNGFTDSQNFVFNLSSTGDTTRYQLKYWNDIDGSPYKEASPWNPSDLAGYSTGLGVYHDNFTQGNGKHYFSFSACDGTGNCSDYGAPFVVTFDNVDPSVPVHVSPADGTVTTTANQTSINWDDSTDANALTYVYQSSLSSAVNPDGSFVAPAYTSGPLGSSEIPTPGTPAGTYHWHVKAVDAAGNESAWSNPWVIVVDNTAPVVTLDTIPDSDDTTPTLTGTVDDPDAVITVSIDGGTPANATNNGDGTWTYTVDPALTTGDYTVTVAATDSAGNGTTPTPTDDFTVTEPVAVVTQTQGGDGAGGGTGTDGGTGAGGGGAGAPAAFFAGFIAGGAGDGDGDGDGAPADQAVAGDTNNANDTNGNVRAGDNAGVAAATTDQSGWRFNWWWLLILAALVAAFYGWYRYRQAQADKTL